MNKLGTSSAGPASGEFAHLPGTTTQPGFDGPSSKSAQAFLADLDELLCSHAGWSVAYRDGSRIGIAGTARELFWKLVQAGEDPARFQIFCIEPQLPVEVEIPHSP